MLNSYFKYSIRWARWVQIMSSAPVVNFGKENFSSASLNDSSYAHEETCCQWMLITWQVETCWVSEW